MDEFDTIQLNVTGCFSADYDLENVTIENDLNPVLEWSADTIRIQPIYSKNGRFSEKTLTRHNGIRLVPFSTIQI